MATIAEALALAVQDHQAGNLQRAEQIYRQVLQADPANAFAWHLLGVVAHQAGRYDLAVAYIGQALALQPQQADFRSNLGLAYQAQGQWEEAEACYRQALRLRPDYPEAHYNLGNVLKDRGRLAEAEACYREALRLRPDYPEAHNNLGSALLRRGRLEEAEACYRQALRLRPGFPEAHNNLGSILQYLGRPDEAEACCREALRLRPGFSEAHNNLGNTLKDMGRLDEALVAYRRAVELDPGSPALHSNLVFALHFHPGCNAGALAAEARRWAERHAGRWQQWAAPHSNDADPERRLRLGYVSADLRDHPVANFLEPLLAGLDRCRFHVTCYADVPRPDATTRRLRDLADGWRDLVGRSDEQVAALVRQDGIDLLVDLGGHTAYNRLLVFARQPAPVQVSYLAYCSTTGLAAIDYRLTDPFLDPPGSPPPYYAEASLWLPQTYWCYRPHLDLPPAGPLPARSAGYVTFGCLNNFCKVTPPALAAWRDLLAAVPRSRLLLHAHPGRHRERVRAFLAAGGVDPARVEFVGFTPLPAYFGLYERIDLGLDPFPYAGGTTTCDALWMGVPVVSLAGETAVARAGLSILSNAGLPELVARTPAEYVRLAAGLAGDLPRLATLRAGLRQRLRGSPLTDAPQFARGVEEAYRTMWRRWCAAQAGWRAPA